jgi:hypothetical protein
MYLIYGLVLIAAAVVMLTMGRPAKGMEAAPFLKVWIAGQAYVAVVLVAFVIGTSFVIMSLPG